MVAVVVVAVTAMVSINQYDKINWRESAEWHE